jgi:4'-phosphopantetheinyl transferase
MMNLFWMQQTEADAPAENDWLTRDEMRRFDAMRFPKRRREWRLGRWTAKCAVAAYFRWHNDPRTLATIEVQNAASGAPEVWLSAKLAPVAISLSHRDGLAMCAVAPANVALGCDLEIIEQRSDAFVEDYFTAEERQLLAQAPVPSRSLLVTVLWSAKESTLKALQQGLRLDTRSVNVTPSGLASQLTGQKNPLADFEHNEQSLQGWSSWHPLHVRYCNALYFDGCYQYTNQFVRTIVTSPSLIAANIVTSRRDKG